MLNPNGVIFVMWFSMLLLSSSVFAEDEFGEMQGKWQKEVDRIATARINYRELVQPGESIADLSFEDISRLVLSVPFTSPPDNFRLLTDKLLRYPNQLAVPWGEEEFVKDGHRTRDNHGNYLFVDDGQNSVYKQTSDNGDEYASINGFAGLPVAKVDISAFIFSPKAIPQVEGATVQSKAILGGDHLFEISYMGKVWIDLLVSSDGNLKRIAHYDENHVPWKAAWYTDYNEIETGIQVPKGIVKVQYASSKLNMLSIRVIDECILNQPVDQTLFTVPIKGGSGVHDFRTGGDPRSVAKVDMTDVTMVKPIPIKDTAIETSTGSSRQMLFFFNLGGIVVLIILLSIKWLFFRN